MDILIIFSEFPCILKAQPYYAFGEYDQDAKEMTAQVKEYLEKGLVNILGGCCGTTPANIKAIAEVTQNYSPRPIHDF